MSSGCQVQAVLCYSPTLHACAAGLMNVRPRTVSKLSVAKRTSVCHKSLNILSHVLNCLQTKLLLGAAGSTSFLGLADSDPSCDST